MISSNKVDGFCPVGELSHTCVSGMCVHTQTHKHTHTCTHIYIYTQQHGNVYTAYIDILTCTIFISHLTFHIHTYKIYNMGSVWGRHNVEMVSCMYPVVWKFYSWIISFMYVFPCLDTWCTGMADWRRCHHLQKPKEDLCDRDCHSTLSSVMEWASEIYIWIKMAGYHFWFTVYAQTAWTCILINRPFLANIRNFV